MHTREGAMWLPSEVEEGNMEYKWCLKDPSPSRLQQLISQMKFRMSEGRGECFYCIGVEDDGCVRGLATFDLEASLAILERMAASLRATATVLERLPAPDGRRGALVHIKAAAAEDGSGCSDLRIAVAGSVDSGKSTLVAVLSNGAGGAPLLDNGAGAARMSVLRHKHELQTGRTSSTSAQMVGYDSQRRVLNYGGVAAALTPAEISAAAAKAATLLDMGGHERCLKTALHGMTCMMPGYMLLCVSAAAGPRHITREHLAVAAALDVPVAFVLTKVDAASDAQLQHALTSVRQLVTTAMRAGSSAPSRTPRCAGGAAGACPWAPAASVGDGADAGSLVTTVAAAVTAAAQLSRLQGTGPGGFRQESFPVLPVSSVTGAGLSVLHAFIASLQPAACTPLAALPRQPQPLRAARSRRLCSCPSAAPAQFQVAQTYEVEGVGAVVCGTAAQGTVEVGQLLMWGPTPEGSFTPIIVAGIQRGQLPVKCVTAGQMATLALQPATHTAAGLQLVAPPPPCGMSPAAMPVASASSASTFSGSSTSSCSSCSDSSGSSSRTCSFRVHAGAAHSPASALHGKAGALHAPPLADVAYREEQLQEAAGLPRSLQAMMHTPELVARLGGGAAAARGADVAAASGAAQPAGDACWFIRGPDGTPVDLVGSGGSSSAADTSSSAGSSSDGEREAAAARGASPGRAGAGLNRAQRRSFRNVRRRAQQAVAAAATASNGRPALVCEPAQPAPVYTVALLPAPSAGLSVALGACLFDDDDDMATGQAVDGFTSTTDFDFDSFSCMDTYGTAATASAPITQPRPTVARSACAAAALVPTAGAAHGGSPTAHLLGSSPPNWRKGAVLLDAALRPSTAWAFDAVMVLLGGHWPPRGLRSRCWPPQEGGAAGDDSDAALSSPGECLVPAARGKARRGRSPDYHQVIHCNSVRQAAGIERMQELDLPGEDGGDNSRLLSWGTRAAAALLLSGVDGGGAAAAGDEDGGELGSVVRVRFRFLHRPEWLQEGARVIVRGRSCSRVAAAGFISAVHYD